MSDKCNVILDESDGASDERDGASDESENIPNELEIAENIPQNRLIVRAKLPFIETL